MAGMTLDQLRVFSEVAKHLSFSRAAEKLYISQPAVSLAIQSLETGYAVKLFHRIGRHHIEITEAGKLLEKEAQKILGKVALTEQGLRELNDLQRGELILGASLSIGSYWLPKKISLFKGLYPKISFKCTIANAETICAGTASGLFDLGLVEGEVGQQYETSLEEEVIGTDRLLIVVGKSHPWFENPVVSITELLNVEWVMREADSGTQQRFEEALKNWGIDLSQLNVISVLNSGEMVKAVVENNVVVAAISELILKKELQLCTLRAVRVIDNRNCQHVAVEIVRPFLKLKHRQRFQSKLCSIFEKMIVASPVELAS